jgi:hypothetical protein
MKVVCYSSFTFSYLNRARVLFSSVRKHHPEWRTVALITDEPPPEMNFSPADEPFDEIVFAQDLNIPNFKSWLFKHDVVEVCTAVKGPFLAQACERDADVVIYLDPDTCLFNRLDPLLDILKSAEIVLTPHQLTPDDEPGAILDNEICSLRTGIFNLGFIAIRTGGEGARFARWWSDRLLKFCYDDIPSGLFVDQRWCDHVPSFFENVKILKDPGYNVASWNLSNRSVSFGPDGTALVNGSPLRFWHFTKLGPMGDTMTRRYAGSNFEVYELWKWYREQVANATEPSIPAGWWAYGRYENGVQISKSHRVLYRGRKDLVTAFPDPFSVQDGGFRGWLGAEGLLE